MELEQRVANAVGEQRIALLVDLASELVPTNILRAFELAQEARTLAGDKPEYRVHLARALIALSRVHSRRGDYEPADAMCNRALALAEDIDDVALWTDAQLARAISLFWQGRGRDASAAAEAARAVARERDHPLGEGDASTLLAQHHIFGGSFAEAEAEYARALPLLARVAPNSALRATVSYVMACYRDGDAQRALAALRANLAACEEAQEPRGRISSLWAIGRVHRDQGDPAKAAEAMTLALDLARSLEYPVQEGHLLAELARVYMAAGANRDALSLARKCVQLCREQGDLRELADGFDALGSAFKHLERHRRALACLRRSLQMHEKLKNRKGVADCLFQIGDTLRGLHRIDEARTLLKQSIRIHRELENPRGEAWSHLALAKIHHDSGDAAAAIPEYRTAAAWADHVDHATMQIDVHRNLSVLYRDLGRHEDAYHHLSILHDLKSAIAEREGAVRKQQVLTKLQQVRRESRVALKESERRYSTLVDNLRVGVFRTTVRGRILFANHAMARILGFASAGSLEGLAARTRLLLSEDRRAFDAVLEEGSVEARALRVKRRDGTVIWCAINAVAVHDDDGRVAHIDGILEDITRRREAETALRERETRLRLLTRQIPAILWTTDHELRFTSLVGSGLKTAGVDSDSLIGSTMEAFFEAEDYVDREHVLSLHRRALAGEHASGELSWGERWWLLHIEPLHDEHARISGTIGITRDVTAEREAEETLRASHDQLRKLATRLQAVREEERKDIAREIHDEFGQLLTALKIEFSWVQSHLVEAPQTLRDRGTSIVSLVETMLTAVRQLATRLRPAMLDELGLEAAIEAHVQAFGERTGCVCDFELSADGLALDNDRDTAMFRTLQEALTNVARHADATRARVVLDTADQKLRLAIHDNGRGITTDELASSGSLGLIGMRERALAMGGTIAFQRGTDGGTVVTVEVPLTQHPN